MDNSNPELDVITQLTDEDIADFIRVAGFERVMVAIGEMFPQHDIHVSTNVNKEYL